MRHRTPWETMFWNNVQWSAWLSTGTYCLSRQIWQCCYWGFRCQRFGLGSISEHYMWDLFEKNCSETSFYSNTSVFSCPHHSSSARYATIRQGTENV